MSVKLHQINDKSASGILFDDLLEALNSDRCSLGKTYLHYVLFKLPKHRRYEYQYRYHDPEKEEAPEAREIYSR